MNKKQYHWIFFIRLLTSMFIMVPVHNNLMASSSTVSISNDEKQSAINKLDSQVKLFNQEFFYPMFQFQLTNQILNEGLESKPNAITNLDNLLIDGSNNLKNLNVQYLEAMVKKYIQENPNLQDPTGADSQNLLQQSKSFRKEIALFVLKDCITGIVKNIVDNDGLKTNYIVTNKINKLQEINTTYLSILNKVFKKTIDINMLKTIITGSIFKGREDCVEQINQAKNVDDLSKYVTAIANCKENFFQKMETNIKSYYKKTKKEFYESLEIKKSLSVSENIESLDQLTEIENIEVLEQIHEQLKQYETMDNLFSIVNQPENKGKVSTTKVKDKIREYYISQNKEIEKKNTRILATKINTHTIEDYNLDFVQEDLKKISSTIYIFKEFYFFYKAIACGLGQNKINDPIEIIKILHQWKYAQDHKDENTGSSDSLPNLNKIKETEFKFIKQITDIYKKRYLGDDYKLDILYDGLNDLEKFFTIENLDTKKTTDYQNWEKIEETINRINFIFNKDKITNQIKKNIQTLVENFQVIEKKLEDNQKQFDQEEAEKKESEQKAKELREQQEREKRLQEFETKLKEKIIKNFISEEFKLKKNIEDSISNKIIKARKLKTEQRAREASAKEQEALAETKRIREQEKQKALEAEKEKQEREAAETARLKQAEEEQRLDAETERQKELEAAAEAEAKRIAQEEEEKRQKELEDRETAAEAQRAKEAAEAKNKTREEEEKKARELKAQQEREAAETARLKQAEEEKRQKALKDAEAAAANQNALDAEIKRQKALEAAAEVTRKAKQNKKLQEEAEVKRIAQEETEKQKQLEGLDLQKTIDDPKITEEPITKEEEKSTDNTTKGIIAAATGLSTIVASQLPPVKKITRELKEVIEKQISKKFGKKKINKNKKNNNNNLEYQDNDINDQYEKYPQNPNQYMNNSQILVY